jgi:hypothetical protein
MERFNPKDDWGFKENAKSHRGYNLSGLSGSSGLVVLRQVFLSCGLRCLRNHPEISTLELTDCTNEVVAKLVSALPLKLSTHLSEFP